MINWQIHPIATIEGFQINLHETIMVFAFLLATVLFGLKAKKEGIEIKHIFNLSVFIFLGGLFGSHSIHVLLHPEFLTYHPTFLDKFIEIFAFWRGGLTSYGAIIVPFFLILIYAWRNKNLRFGKVADIISPFIALGFAVQRVGCFLNGCCFGKPTKLPWGVIYNPDSPAGFIYGEVPLHPTQLYLLIGNLFIFLILLNLGKIKNKIKLINFEGSVFLAFLILFSIERFFINFLRHSSPDEPYIGFLSRGQIFCAFIFYISIYFLIKNQKKDIKKI